MKTICLVISLLVSGLAQAATWEKMFDCENGAAVVDVDKDERRNLQLVIRDQGILRYLYSVGAISLKYGDTETIISGWQGHGVFNPGDFRYFNAEPKTMWENRYAYVTREGEGVKVRFTQRSSYTVKPVGCEDCLSMACESSCSSVTTERETANWYFRSCR